MSVVTIGNFDGVHIGHRRLLDATVSAARRRGAKSCAVTFERLFSVERGRILTPIDEKIELLKSAGLDEIMVLPGEKRLWEMSPECFASEIIAGLRPEAIVAGYDFRFGKDAAGTPGILKNLLGPGVSVNIERPVFLDGNIVSSSAIRHFLESGDAVRAAAALGRFYSIEGASKKGAGMAGKMGFPTINLAISDDKLLPCGIFAARVARKGAGRGGVAPAVAYIGRSPTMLGLKQPRAEFHIPAMRPSMPAGGEWVVFLVKKIRAERKFPSGAMLKKQIEKDIIEATKEVK